MAHAPLELADKIGIALQRANMSRARLAFEAKVDKSLVGRWVRGLVVPSENNLAIVTEVFALRFKGFNLTSWHLPMTAFTEHLGGSIAPPAVGDFARQDPMLLRSFAISRATMERDGQNHLGVYLGFRQGLSMGRRLICDLYVIWREGESLYFRQWGLTFGHAGPVCLLRSQLYLMGEDIGTIHSLFFTMLNGVVVGRAVRMNGLILCAAGIHRVNTPSATTVVWQRIADIPPGGGCPNPALFERLIQRVRVLVAEDGLQEMIAPEILAAITMISPDMAASNLPILQIDAQRTLSCSAIECDEAMAHYIAKLREVFLAEDSGTLPMAELEGAPGSAFLDYAGE